MGQSADQLRREIDETRQDLSGTLDAIGDRVSPGRIVQRRTERVRRVFSSARESVMGSAEMVSDTAQGATGQAGSAVSTVASTARHAPQQMLRQTEGNPLAAGLVAFGVGLVVASIIPASEPEQRVAEALQDKVEPLREQLTEATRQVKDEVQDATRTAAEHVKETVSEAAGEVRDQAQSSAEHVKDEATSTAEGARSGE